MTRSELIQKLSILHPQFTSKDVELAVHTILASMGCALAQGGRVEIRDFGSFRLNYRPVRVGRNPKTGELVNVPAKFAPAFKAGKELRERINSDSVNGI